jgi:protein-S-isoprenylcysteine O-methyltransferase Ste14
MQSLLTVLGAFAAFAVVHSLTAGLKPKGLLARILPERFVLGWYRLFYNIFATLTFIPVLVLVALLPAETLYRVESTPLVVLLILLQGAGVVGLLVSLLQVDLMRFIGFKQAAAYLQGRPLPLPDEPLVTSGMYGLVRHPLYFFGLLILWPSPVMTTTQLGFNLGITAYVVIGSLIEERRMRRFFGDEYKEYQQHVPWLLPLPRKG